MRPRLVIAALSARLLAESARAAGYDVIALDVFGDRDTRAASVRWLPIGAGGLRIDAALLCDALRSLDAAGWVAGAGIEPHLAAAAAAAPDSMPLLGNAPEVVGAVRDPALFFAALDELGIAHPPVRLELRHDTRGWLWKDFAGSGGWHIDHASAPAVPASPSRYAQRAHAGAPMSALFVADGRAARVLGVQRQLVRPLLGRPYVFRGVVGPVEIGAAPRDAIERIVAQLVARFALRGLGSVDLLVEGDAIAVLEINPRPTASLALYDRAGSMLRAHLDACRDGRLCDAPRADGVRGTEIVFAAHDAAIAGEHLEAQPWRHDLPHGVAGFERGEPVCTVSAHEATEQQVIERLAQRRQDVLAALDFSA